MTALLYFLVAVVAVSLPVWAWLEDREDSTRPIFLSLGVTLAVAYAAFALSLLPGLAEVRLLYTVAGCFVPATTLMTIDRVFWRDRPGSPWTSLLLFGAALVAPSVALAHLMFYLGVPRISPPEIIAGVFTAGGFTALLWRLGEAHEAAVLQVEKTRIRYLAAVLVAAIVFTFAEQLARGLGSQVDAAQLSLASRGVALQGAIPPFGAVFAGIALYFLFHSVASYRLLDLQEILSRTAILLASAVVLLLVDGITFIWVDTFTVYPFHSTFQLFLASLLFLAAYEPLRSSIAYLANRSLNARGQQLTEAFDHLERRLPGVITANALVEELLDPLHASGRVPMCSIYLWDPRIDAFRFAGSRGQADRRPLEAVATRPFTTGFVEGIEWYQIDDIARRARSSPEWTEVYALMEAMDAHLTIPFTSGGTVLGWIHLTHEPWSDGFSLEEMQRLTEIARLASVVLANIQDFRALEQQGRLAALGRMAAGLAHEIRNPLAGVKGAAQYLETEDLKEDSKEMLHVIVDEVNRLDIVVSQFLDYARPFELQLQPEHINALVAHSIAVLRAQGLPEGVQIDEELGGDLPRVQVDAARLSQVVLNLLKNGLEAMTDGGTLTVRTRTRYGRSGSPEVEIAVTDTGVGIAREDMDHLFIPFFTTKTEGTGLGLPICERIVEAHGGELDVTSRPGHGSTFLVRLPAPLATLDRAPEPEAV